MSEIDIPVIVIGQKVRVPISMKTIVSGTKGFIRFVFDLDSNWNGLTKTARFVQGDIVESKILDSNNSCLFPENITTGSFTMFLYGADSKTSATTSSVLFRLIDNDEGINDFTTQKDSSVSASDIQSAVSSYMASHPMNISLEVDSNGNGTFVIT